MALDVLSQSRCFDGTQLTYQHRSSETGTMMRFAAFVPPQARQAPVPVVWYLSGLTCTEENFTVKAGAQRIAAELGLLLIAPDTSPRGEEAHARCNWPFCSDSCALLEDGARLPELLVDQGTADQFLETQLKPELLERACSRAGIPLKLRIHEGYDHSYFFISTFIEDHLRWRSG